jgi:hypothetical protein
MKMNKIFRRSAVGLASAAALASGAALVSGGVSVGAGLASSVSSPKVPKGWRIVATPDTNASLDDLAVVNAKSAWAVGGGTGGALVRHWDGTAWRKVGLPRGLTTTGLASVSASSDSNVWISGDAVDKLYILHWDGHRWQATPEPRNTYAPKILAVGAKNAWAFYGVEAANGVFHADTRYFDGSHWSRVKSPSPVGMVSALSSKDIWATGWDCQCVAAGSIEHWNGKAWAKPVQPPMTGNSKKYWGAVYNGIVARSDKDVWVLGAANPKTSPRASVFLHWNGKTWTELAAPSGTTEWRNGLTEDGAGGFWAVSPYPTPAMYHYRAGTWTAVPLPGKSGYSTEITNLARIPLTTSIWGVGRLNQGNHVGTLDMILKYGN